MTMKMFAKVVEKLTGIAPYAVALPMLAEAKNAIFANTKLNVPHYGEKEGIGGSMEKVFALRETHFPTNNLAIYSTLDRRVIYVASLHPIEWPNRATEEVFRCNKCKHFILPNEGHLCQQEKNGKKEVTHGASTSGTHD